MDNRDVAGEQIGELRQEQRRPQVAHEPLVEKGVRVGGFALVAQDCSVDRDIALAAAGGHNHVHARKQLAIAFDAGVCQRQPSGIGADPLPRLHLALIALFRDLLVEVERSERMDEIWREAFGVDLDSSFRQALPMRLRPFAEARHDADAGDPNLAWQLSHERGPRWGTRGSRPSSPCWRGARGWEIQPTGT